VNVFEGNMVVMLWSDDRIWEQDRLEIAEQEAGKSVVLEFV
jgi:hypothetical protein